MGTTILPIERAGPVGMTDQDLQMLLLCGVLSSHRSSPECYMEITQ